ncbi:uncharacterized protein LOC114935506 isoform X2 [Nylanderia fulva]|uniref:uncharacterized protein LOC114935506 isoform X2 n=1 Tax=Nylanderia fulva TaxID=613905 RepID=UPI0010FB9F1E|nr:uncharacterized protein LOC114935506 isoform X2 [Nylanderia fulva]
MPKSRKPTFYSRQHKNRLVRHAIHDFELNNIQDRDEVDYLTEPDAAQSNIVNYRQLQQNSDSLSELHENNADYQLIQQEIAIEEEENVNINENINENVEFGIPSDEYESDEDEDLLESEHEINNEINIARLRKNLVQWVHDNNISISAVTNLLRVLKKEEIMSCLPTDGRTLLRTPRKANVIEMEYGHFRYFGIEEGLRHTIKKCDIRCIPEEIHLSVNVDGLPLVKSSRSGLWTILASFRNFVDKTPFLVGAFHGFKKAPSAAVFLHDFIEEAQNLMQNGFNWKDNRIKFFIDNFICDAPARAYISCTKAHTGYYGCPKCETKGIYRGKVVFPEMNAPLRTAESFVNQTQQQHHNEFY